MFELNNDRFNSLAEIQAIGLEDNSVSTLTMGFTNLEEYDFHLTSDSGCLGIGDITVSLERDKEFNLFNAPRAPGAFVYNSEN